MSALSREIAARVDRLRIPFNAANVDPYGISKPHVVRAAELVTLFYRKYFRVSCTGVENVPTEGRCMLVGNHSGGFALDAGMLAAACFWELEPPRLAQAMVDRFVYRLPFLSPWMSRLGQFAGLPEHAKRLLADERLLMVFPEGTRGTAKTFSERYTLVRFGTGFVRLALATHCPIVPVAILGGGEAVPTAMNLYKLGKLLGAPYIPITPYLVPAPLPVRIMIRFGQPLQFSGDPNDNDARVGEHVDVVQSRIAELIEAGRQEYTAL
jgi:1-acyl-sn-glycerol-3-phosphate acyltransferase